MTSVPRLQGVQPVREIRRSSDAIGVSPAISRAGADFPRTASTTPVVGIIRVTDAFVFEHPHTVELSHAGTYPAIGGILAEIAMTGS